MSRKPGPHALAFLLFSIVISTLGFGLIIPVTPGLIVELTGEPVSAAAIYGGWLMFTFSLMMFLFSPVLGNLSDRFGRRPVIVLSMAVLAIDYLIMAFAGSIFWLFVGRFLAGAAGASFVAANAYIADITPESERAGRFGLIGAAWGIGFICGPALGGLLSEYGLRTPFFVASALSALNLVYGLTVLPETLAPENRRPFRFWRASPFGALASLKKTPALLGLSLALILYYVAHDSLPSAWTYYVLHSFSWSESRVGLALMVIGISSALVSGLLVRPIVGRFGEIRTAYLGCVLACLSFFGYAYASAGWMLIPSMILTGFMGLVMPSLRGIFSRAAGADEQGNMQGAIAGLFGLVSIFSPLLMTRVFHAFSAPEAGFYFPGAPFFLAGCLILAAALVIFAVSRKALVASQAPPVST